jgi:dinuclear metal center YbgI/SA1388 family protein
MPYTISEVCNFLDQLAPQAYKESWDNVGVLVGDVQQPLKGMLVNLDCTPEVVQEAIDTGCNLIVSHHPIVFSGLKKFTGQNYIQKAVMLAIKHDIVLYACHTNLDKVNYGVSKMMADKLKLINTQVLRASEDMLMSLVVFCPENHAEDVREALFAAGAGTIGNYDQCSFNGSGTGTFRANPFIGKAGIQEQVHEIRIEVVFERHLQSHILKAMLAAHPYEEVAHYLYPLSNTHKEVGLGMIGELEKPVPVLELLAEVKKAFGCSMLKYTKAKKNKVQRIAVCGGSGIEFLSDAKRAKADVYITADVKYHQFFDAEEDLILIDIGHYESEHHSSNWICTEVQKKFPNFAPQLSKVNTNPVNYL